MNDRRAGRQVMSIKGWLLRQADVKEILRNMSFTSARWRDVFLAAGARGISYAGDFLAATALILTLAEHGAGGYAVAAILLAATVPMIVFGPLGGRLADSIDSRPLLTIVGLAQAACCAAMAVASHPVALIALAALLSSGLAITQPTFGALLPEMVERSDLPRAMAVNQSAASIGMLAGPALAGFLVQGYGLRVPLLIDAASYLAIVVAALAIRTRRNVRTVTPPPASPAPWRLREDLLFRLLFPVMAAVLGAVSMVNVVVVFFIRETLDASAAAYGLLESVWMAAMLAGAWLSTRMAGSDVRLVVLLVTALGVSSGAFVVASTVTHVGWLAPVYVVGGMCNGAENTVAQLLIAHRVAAASRGRAIAALLAVTNTAVTIGYAVSAPTVELLGPRLAVCVPGAIGLVLVVALAVPMLRRARRESRSGHQLLGDLPANTGTVVLTK